MSSHVRGEMEWPFAVRFRLARSTVTPFSAPVRHGHVWNWSTGGVEDDTFDPLSELGLFENYECSNRLRRSDQKCARERDQDYPTHKTIIGQRSS